MFLALAALLLAPPALAGAEGAIVYTEVDNDPLSLDRWLPEGDGPFPGVLIIHGGGWKYGDLRQGVEPAALAAAAAGLVAVSPNYRLSEEAPWPAQLDDVACALRWMRSNAEALRLDPDRIAVAGHSAGGHLALMLAEAPEREPPATCAHHADGTVQSAVSVAGPSDMQTFYDATLWWGRKMTRELLGLSAFASPKKLARQLASASPLSYLDAVGPPVLQVVGAEDPLVPGAVAAAYDAALRRVGRTSRVVTVPGAGHNDVNRVEHWLSQVLEDLRP